MANVKLEGISKSYSVVEVLKDIDLDIADGEFCVFVGPSGCGKSTLLRMIAGLEDITSGTLSIGGRKVNDLSPKERGIAMVFQSYALYPHRTVRGNMEFGLKLSRLPRAEIDKRVARAAKMLQIEHLLDRRPSQLSGGQRQRAAIGRAVVRDPSVFLFDEPLSNLDAALRVSTRREIADLHRELGATMIYVTHDQVEAMTLADRIVVLNDGVIQQVGSPMALYETPANLFVAQFIGSARMNIFDATVTALSDQTAVLAVAELGEVSIPVRGRTLAKGDAVKFGIRPEHLSPASDGPHNAQVRAVEHLGDQVLVEAALADGTALLLKAPPSAQLGHGEAMRFALDAQAVHLFDADGRAIAPVAP
ncbi:MAG TPA: sn-glycerol-3-phosphate ABC transporter ATP-binding protein UgpC [Pelagibacterium sp.]|uniref:ABC transporter ATP-binding protein n=1 Tax=Pelagibacterium sp. TaxID=1967288 RepID=UPI002C7DE41E|nr:sn-glycerol-3-phosphate ABC transporter ATP-binding protein UgpC [Pelagibacterium sp.]HWJ87113.1 sn-glycerol-3-phosphate ABC transporter ATP-binding protein UgpC [Pelagibacterium sp.]